jgi:hypothetical protein
MPTYLPNVVTRLFAYGYGDTRNGVIPYNPIYEGFPEYAIKVNSSFFVETGSLFIPAYSAPQNGFYITYVQPGWSYRSRVSIRPTFVPFRKDFFDYAFSGDNPTIDDGYEKLNTAGEEDHTEIVLNVIKVRTGGFISYGGRTIYQDDKEILVSANGQYTVQWYAFPWPLATSPIPSRNVDGMQIGAIIKFFSEDQYSIICFDNVEDIRAKLNKLPEF